MYLVYVSLLLILLVMSYMLFLIFKVTKKQCLKKIHLEINKGIRFDSEFYNGEKNRKPHTSKP
ncbi:MAG: hypothetical protein N2484_00595 [Clostridia bacterium]|nr:hypothetical protein [Clostridia bacterium]